MPHLSEAQWVAVFQVAILPFFAWFIKWTGHKVVKDIRETVEGVADGPAKARAAEVRLELLRGQAELQAMFKKEMDDHEHKDADRHSTAIGMNDELRRLIQGMKPQKGV